MCSTLLTRVRGTRIGRWLPPDLAAVVIVTGLTAVAVFTPVITATPLRVPLSIAFVLFVPGYAVVAALFPERNQSAVTERDDEPAPTSTSNSHGRTRWLGNGTGIDGVDRLSLSVVSSVIVVSVIGVAMNYTPWGIHPGPVLAAVSATTLLTTGLASYRRQALDPSIRFVLPLERWTTTVYGAFHHPDSRADILLTGVLVIAVGIALTSVGFAIVGPGITDDGSVGDDPDGFSAMSLLDDDGAFLTNESAVLEDDETASDITISIENNEHRSVTYTVVAVEQELDDDGDEPTVTDETELDRYETEVAHGESDTLEHDLDLSDEETRLVWLLYADTVPDEPTAMNADAYVTLFVPAEE